MSRTEENAYWDSIWSGVKGKLEPFQLEKYARITEILPEDVRSIVDVGCGSGQFTNQLVDRYRVLGVDFSKAALQHLECEGRIGDITDLPVADREFDMAMAMEVLEHLPHDGSLERATTELARVAANYVLITVPANDDPIYYAARCPVCQSRFHQAQHLRYFTADDFPRLIPGFRLARLLQTGRRVIGSKFLIQLAMATSPYTGLAREGVPCLVCGELVKTIRIRSSIFSLTLLSLDHAIVALKSLLHIGTAHNFVALYERED